MTRAVQTQNESKYDDSAAWGKEKEDTQQTNKYEETRKKTN